MSSPRSGADERKALEAAIARHPAAAKALPQLLQSAVMVARDAIVLTTGAIPGAVIEFVNPAFSDLFGYEPDEVLGESPRLLVGKKTDEAVLDALREELAGGDSSAGETWLYTKEGSSIAIGWSVSPIIDADGGATHFVAVLQDITERYRAEEELREQSRISETLRYFASALSAELDLGQLARDLVDAARGLTGAQVGAFFYEVMGEMGISEQRTAQSGWGAEALDDARLPTTMTDFDPELGEHAAVRLDDVTDDPRYGRPPPFAAKPRKGRTVRSYLAVPVRSRNTGLLGGIFLGHGRPAIFTDADEKLVVGLASQAAIAIDNSLVFEHERQAARILQQSLLPDQLPEIEGVELRAKYLSGTEGVDVGGDWYDVIRLPSGGIGLAVGDVTGRGLRAAAVMGQLRHVLRALALEGTSPGRALTRLNQLSVEDDRLATAVVMTIGADHKHLRYARAGHPPPALVSPDRSVRLLAEANGAPIGAVTDADFEDEVVDIEPGSVLVLYTDGLVERRGESLEDGLSRLTTALQYETDDLDELCEHVASELLDPAEHPDDTALLLVRIVEVDEVDESE